MANFIVALVIIAIIAMSVRKIVTEKKRGAKCVGCPYAGSNGNSCASSCE